jgi:ubiquinone/menaquinone biosynthesis C-methylase UbiE
VEAANYVASAERNWASEPITWGIWHVPEAEVGALPDVTDMDVVELGCGTAYVSAWVARRRAGPTGVDLTEAQLATAREMQARHGLEFPLVHASAEAVPLPDGCADLVISEYGASLWCEPGAWIAEAVRLLRPAGHLVFLTNSLLVALTAPASGPCDDRLVRAQRRTARPHVAGRGGRRVPPAARRVDRAAAPQRPDGDGPARALRARRRRPDAI